MADYLEELLKDTPMGRLKLLAAWDSLGTETQIRILGEMSEKGRGKYSNRAIWLKALSSPSEYVRYLAARGTRFFGVSLLFGMRPSVPPERADEIEIIESKIMSDASPLVRSTRGQSFGATFGTFSGKVSDRFAKEDKLAVVSDDDPPLPEKLARWVEHAAETKSVSDEEIYDVVLEYLCNPKSLEHLQSNPDYVFGTEGTEGREAGFNAFWRLVPKVPSSVAYCLVGRLPWEGPYGTEPPSDVQTWLKTSPYLESLLWREDAPLMELRREIFFSTDPKYDGAKSGAVRNNFYLGLGELHDLFKQNSELLSRLAWFSPCLSPVMLLALKDSSLKGDATHPTWDEGCFCEKNFKSALAKLKGGTLHPFPYGSDREIRFLRVYQLAKSVMGWRAKGPDLDALPEPLKFLADKVVNGDTWGTFVAFEKEIATPRFDHLLPRLEDLDLSYFEESPTGATQAKSVNDARENQKAIEATTSAARPTRGSSLLGNTIIVLGIVAALLTILFAVVGILDNEYRNFGSGVIAMAISAGAIVFVGSQLRSSK